MKTTLLSLLTMTFFSMATSSLFAECGAPTGTPAAIAEIVSFKLASGVTDDAFLAAADNMEKTYLCNVRGFIGRTLSKDEEGNWIDHLEWASLKDAMAAMTGSAAEKSAAPFLQAIVSDSVNLKHWTIVRQSR
jgi:hypothetical protein